MEPALLGAAVSEKSSLTPLAQYIRPTAPPGLLVAYLESQEIDTVHIAATAEPEIVDGLLLSGEEKQRVLLWQLCFAAQRPLDFIEIEPSLDPQGYQLNRTKSGAKVHVTLLSRKEARQRLRAIAALPPDTVVPVLGVATPTTTGLLRLVSAHYPCSLQLMLDEARVPEDPAPLLVSIAKVLTEVHACGIKIGLDPSNIFLEDTPSMSPVQTIRIDILNSEVSTTHTFEADVCSFGFLMVALLLKQLPSGLAHALQLLASARSSQLHWSLRNLVCRCFLPSAKRPKAAAIMKELKDTSTPSTYAPQPQTDAPVLVLSSESNLFLRWDDVQQAMSLTKARESATVFSLLIGGDGIRIILDRSSNLFSKQELSEPYLHTLRLHFCGTEADQRWQIWTENAYWYEHRTRIEVGVAEMPASFSFTKPVPKLAVSPLILKDLPCDSVKKNLAGIPEHFFEEAKMARAIFVKEGVVVLFGPPGIGKRVISSLIWADVTTCTEIPRATVPEIFEKDTSWNLDETCNLVVSVRTDLSPAEEQQLEKLVTNPARKAKLIIVTRQYLQTLDKFTRSIVRLSDDDVKLFLRNKLAAIPSTEMRLRGSICNQIAAFRGSWTVVQNFASLLDRPTSCWQNINVAECSVAANKTDITAWVQQLSLSPKELFLLRTLYRFPLGIPLRDFQCIVTEHSSHPCIPAYSFPEDASFERLLRRGIVYRAPPEGEVLVACPLVSREVFTRHSEYAHADIGIVNHCFQLLQPMLASKSSPAKVVESPVAVEPVAPTPAAVTMLSPLPTLMSSPTQMLSPRGKLVVPARKTSLPPPIIPRSATPGPGYCATAPSFPNTNYWGAFEACIALLSSYKLQDAGRSLAKAWKFAVDFTTLLYFNGNLYAALCAAALIQARIHAQLDASLLFNWHLLHAELQHAVFNFKAASRSCDAGLKIDSIEEGSALLALLALEIEMDRWFFAEVYEDAVGARPSAVSCDTLLSKYEARLPDDIRKAYPFLLRGKLSQLKAEHQHAYEIYADAMKAADEALSVARGEDPARIHRLVRIRQAALAAKELIALNYSDPAMRGRGEDAGKETARYPLGRPQAKTYHTPLLHYIHTQIKSDDYSAPDVQEGLRIALDLASEMGHAPLAIQVALELCFVALTREDYPRAEKLLKCATAAASDELFAFHKQVESRIKQYRNMIDHKPSQGLPVVMTRSNQNCWSHAGPSCRKVFFQNRGTPLEPWEWSLDLKVWQGITRNRDSLSVSDEGRWRDYTPSPCNGWIIRYLLSHQTFEVSNEQVAEKLAFRTDNHALLAALSQLPGRAVAIKDGIKEEKTRLKALHMSSPLVWAVASGAVNCVDFLLRTQLSTEPNFLHTSPLHWIPVAPARHQARLLSALRNSTHVMCQELFAADREGKLIDRWDLRPSSVRHLVDAEKSFVDEARKSGLSVLQLGIERVDDATKTLVKHLLTVGGNICWCPTLVLAVLRSDKTLSLSEDKRALLGLWSAELRDVALFSAIYNELNVPWKAYAKRETEYGFTTPLHWAVAFGRVGIVNELLKYKPWSKANTFDTKEASYELAIVLGRPEVLTDNFLRAIVCTSEVYGRIKSRYKYLRLRLPRAEASRERSLLKLAWTKFKYRPALAPIPVSIPDAIPFLQGASDTLTETLLLLPALLVLVFSGLQCIEIHDKSTFESLLRPYDLNGLSAKLDSLLDEVVLELVDNKLFVHFPPYQQVRAELDGLQAPLSTLLENLPRRFRKFAQAPRGDLTFFLAGQPNNLAIRIVWDADRASRSPPSVNIRSETL